MADPLVLGIDVGTTSIKVILLQKAGSTYVARDLVIEPLPHQESSIDMNDTSVESYHLNWELISEVLAKIIKEHGLKKHRSAFALQGSAVAPRFFSFPQMDIDNVGNAINFEAQETVPFEVSPSQIGWELFPPDVNQNPPKMEGLFVAGMKEIVDTVYDMAYDVGLEPVIVDHSAIACANAFLEVGEGQIEKNTLILNIGNKITNLIVLTPEGRIFVRDIVSGGSDITKSISTQYGMEFDKAEVLKTGGIIGQPNNQENITKMMEDKDTLIEEGFYNLIMQIRDTLRYFIAQRYISIIDEINITGGSAMFPGIIDFLGDNLELPSIGWNVLYDISLQGLPAAKNRAYIESIGPMMAVATGLAMRLDIK